MKTYKGEWFLPNSKEKKIPGILSIDRENSEILLELYSEKPISRDFNGQIMHGLSGIEKITLYNCSAEVEEAISPFITSKLIVNFEEFRHKKSFSSNTNNLQKCVSIVTNFREDIPQE